MAIRRARSQGPVDIIWRQIQELWAAVKWSSAAGGLSGNRIIVQTQAGAGVVVGTAAAPYAIKSSDRWILFNADSAGTQAAAQLSSGTFKGERHTFWYALWGNAGNPQPLIMYNGCIGSVFNPGAVQSGMTTANLNPAGQQTVGQPYVIVTVEWDGNEWIQVQ